MRNCTKSLIDRSAKVLLVCLAMQAGVLLADTASKPANPVSPARAGDASRSALSLQGPIWVHDNWGIYDPLWSMPLTEELALREVQEVARMKRQGVRFDYYMMNAFWFQDGGGYREWDKRYWPEGPDRWLEACRKNGLKPGLWFGCNLLWHIGVSPAWADSYAGDDHRPYGRDMKGSLSMFEGGFLPDFIKALQHWYDRGVRLFEFDMADMYAATPATRAVLSREEIHRRNKEAMIAALTAFRQKNPEAILVGFNGFWQPDHSTDPDWLAVFSTLFSGDIRMSNVPGENYWRSMDIFNDERVRMMEDAGVPQHRIDPCGFVLSQTQFGDFRQAIEWKGMILQNLARGAWKQTVYGALATIPSDEEARWFAKAQKLYEPLLTKGRTRSFGGKPSDIEPYGYVSFDQGGALYTVINPAQAVREVALEPVPGKRTGGRVLFRDAGFAPVLNQGMLTLGPGQMAVVGYGRYDRMESDLGIQQDVVIPQKIAPLTVEFRETAPNTLEATFIPPGQGDLRIVFQQFSPEGKPLKLQRYQSPWDPVAAKGPTPDNGLRIDVWQPGFSLPVARDQCTTPSGISWGVGEVRQDHLVAGRPITIRCTTVDKRPVKLEARIYTVEY